MTRSNLLSSWWISLLFASACAGSSKMVCRPDAISGAERCQQTGGYGDAAITGGAAAGVWAAAGCTVNGCEPPYRCNGKTKQCERQTCSEVAHCPPGYTCDPRDRTCH